MPGTARFIDLMEQIGYQLIMKSAFITVSGRPSAGKSTLINKICGYKVSIVSSTPQTTRNKIRGIVTDERGQLVFLDTPGYHISDKLINTQLKEVAEDAVSESDLILYVVDPTRDLGEEENKLLEFLSKSSSSIVIAFNKIDVLEERGKNKLEFIESLQNFFRKRISPSGSDDKRDISFFSVSAKSGEGVDKLLDKIYELSPEGEMMYPPDYYTDQDVEFRICEIIREKAINRTKEEIPHSVYVEIADTEMGFNPDGTEKLWVRAFLVAESESQKGILIGKGGEKIKAIRIAAKREIKSIFPYTVQLDLRVKVHKNWRKKGALLNRLIK